jgi:DNA-binding response OmpR family regulator
MNTATILLVEDDERTRKLVQVYLEREGYTVLVTGNGTDAVDIARRSLPALVLLDLMLPGMSGLEVCRTLRTESNPLVIMLTARTTEEDKVIGLDNGADDYIAKPFSPRELLARIRAVLRRSIAPSADAEDTVGVGDLLLDLHGKRVNLAGVEIRVTPVEFRILLLLLQNRGVVFSREQLIERVFGYEYEGLERTVDAHIKNLRRKIETDRGSLHYIRTRFGLGYYCPAGDT